VDRNTAGETGEIPRWHPNARKTGSRRGPRLVPVCRSDLDPNRIAA